MRLNKFISETGACSRRQADLWIEQGRVTINGQPAALGTKVRPEDAVRLDGKPLAAKTAPIYIALNKPVGITCTTETNVPGNILELVGHQERIFPIGRLDKDSEGLILLTNDGDVVNYVLRAENEHEKEYLVDLDRPISDVSLGVMASGVRIMGVMTKPCKIARVNPRVFRITLTQGLNRQIRRMCSALGFKVQRLQRVRIMDIHLGKLPAGQWRLLTEAESQQLTAASTPRP
jgi:23S rRNA pseudouridine2604 synthase